MQLDLFTTDCKPQAEVIMFPLVRRREVIRQAARQMAVMSDAQIIKYWRKLAKQIAEPLIAAGIPRQVVRDQVADLYDKIIMEAFWDGDTDMSPSERA